MKHITNQLYKQITGWRVYSVVAPSIFSACSAFLYLYYGTPFQTLFYAGLIVLGVTCISWWHWSLSTMISMICIMRDTDDHFEQVAKQLAELQSSIKAKQPNLIVLKNVDRQE